MHQGEKADPMAYNKEKSGAKSSTKPAKRTTKLRIISDRSLAYTKLTLRAE